MSKVTSLDCVPDLQIKAIRLLDNELDRLVEKQAADGYLEKDDVRMINSIMGALNPTYKDHYAIKNGISLGMQKIADVSVLQNIINNYGPAMSLPEMPELPIGLLEKINAKE